MLVSKAVPPPSGEPDPLPSAPRPSAPDRARILIVVHEEGAGPGRLRPLLEAAADLDLRHPYRGDRLPPDLTGYDGLIVLGGSMGATDDDAAGWLPLTRRLLAAGVELRIPTWGICLGAQLLAVATGGRVDRGQAGWEVGAAPVELLPEAAADPLFGPTLGLLGRTLLVPQFHQDAVTALPPGAVVVATGNRYPHQGFRLGELAWGVQYHPEVTVTDFVGWLREDAATLRAANLDTNALARAFAAVGEPLETLAAAHGRAFAALITSRHLRESRNYS